MRIAHAIPASDPEPPCAEPLLASPAKQSSTGQAGSGSNMVYDHITTSYLQLACLPSRMSSVPEYIGGAGLRGEASPLPVACGGTSRPQGGTTRR